MSEKIIDNDPISGYATDWGDPDGTGTKEKSLGVVQTFIKAKLQGNENGIGSAAARITALENRPFAFAGITGNATDNTSLAAELNGKFGKVSCTYAVDEASQLSTKTHGVGLTCLCKGDGKIYTSDGSAWNAGVLGVLGVLYIAESETYVYDTNKFVLISTENALTLNGKDQNYFAKESEAAKKSGYYPNMGVGSADNLNGVDTVNAQYLRRTSGGSADIGSGVAKIGSLKGNSIVIKQIIPKLTGIIEVENTDWVKLGGFVMPVITETSDEISITNIGILQPNEKYRQNLIIGNKYYFICRAKSSSTNDYIYCSPLRGGNIDKFINADEYMTLKLFGTAIREWGNQGIRFHSNSYVNVLTVDKRVGMMMIDVTCIEQSTGKTFGTLADFENWAASMGIDIEHWIPYNAGEVINCKADAIKTDGFNQYNHSTGKVNVIKGNVYQITGAYTSLTLGGETITPDASGYFTPTTSGELAVTGGDATTCVHLKWSGKKDGEFENYWSENLNLNLTSITGKVDGQGASETIYTDGLVKVGNVADELVVDSDGKARHSIKRFGNQSITGAIGDEITLTGCKADTTAAVCAQGALSAVGTLSGTTLTLTVAVTSLDVYFELATPINYTLDTPLDMTYRVDDWGTETAMVLSSGSLVQADITKTAPLNYEVRYALNVVDTVRNLNRNYLGMTGTNNTLAAIASALAGYGMTLTLGTFDETNQYYQATITGGWKPASAAPASASATGTKGMYYIDTDCFYVCVDTNTWKRFALSTW